jgi:hypothetical protein
LKKTIAIFLVAIYLLATTQLSELFKLPLLVQHFNEHKQENLSLSFIDFLKIHYAHGSTKVADYDEDMKLPFKSVSTINITAIEFCATFFIVKQLPVLYFQINQQKFTDYSFSYSSAILTSIWQPPKYC